MSAALTDWLMTRNTQLEMQAERQRERLAAVERIGGIRRRDHRL